MRNKKLAILLVVLMVIVCQSSAEALSMSKKTKKSIRKTLGKVVTPNNVGKGIDALSAYFNSKNNKPNTVVNQNNSVNINLLQNSA